ncbi:MAG: STAS domain-containing protein [Pontiellaceae bacterium]
MTSFDDQNNLTAAEVNSSIYVCVNGRGSFQNSTALKEYVKKQLIKTSPKKILLDMTSCSGMDSTFMGVLAGLASSTKKTNSHTFTLINLSKKNEKLLTTLGVSKILDYQSDDKSNIKNKINDDNLSALTANQNKTTKTSLEAHKTLVKIEPKNLKEFKNVIELLEQDLNQSKEIT